MSLAPDNIIKIMRVNFMSGIFINKLIQLSSGMEIISLFTKALLFFTCEFNSSAWLLKPM